MSLELTGTLQWYKSWSLEQGRAANLASDSFKMLLCTEDYAPDAENHSQLSDITNEVADAGYARQTLQNVSWAFAGSVAVFSFDPVVFEAPDGDIPCKYWVLYDDTTSGDLLMCYGLLSSNGSSVTIEDGKDMTLSFVGGLFQQQFQS